MNNYQQEQLENIRRTCERGIQTVEKHDWTGLLIETMVDTFLNILNSVELIKNENTITRHRNSA